MAPQGLNELKELSTEADELKERAWCLTVRTVELQECDEDAETIGAHDLLTKATISLQKAVWQLGRAAAEMRSAYTAEKSLMDFCAGLLKYEELLNKQDNDDR